MSVNSQTRMCVSASDKQRVPLTVEQRQKRRVVMAAVLCDLADAAGCSKNVSNGKLFQVVVNILRKSTTGKKRRTIKQLVENADELVEAMNELARLEDHHTIAKIVDWLHLPEGSTLLVNTEG